MRRPSPRHAAVACALALAPTFSCASSGESPLGDFHAAWEDAYDDTKSLFGEQFFLMDSDDPYARAGGWSAQGYDSGRRAARLFLDEGGHSEPSVPRVGQNRGENSAGHLWAWLLDLD